MCLQLNAIREPLHLIALYTVHIDEVQNYKSNDTFYLITLDLITLISL